MILLDGKKLSAEIKAELKNEVENIRAKGGKIPHLAAILVGNDGASETYVKSKVKSCEEVGFSSTLLRFEESISEQELLTEIQKMNENPDIDGFIVQLPLPKHISETKVIETIAPEKDVDGFHPINIGRMAKNLPAYIPATPFGILQMLERYKIETTGKHCVVVGRSNIVGSPMSILMARNAPIGNCTVTLCHSKTKDLSKFTQEADILIVALGKPEFVTANMIKEGAVVIDVGITRLPDESSAKGYRIVGDVKFDEVAPKCSYITPVPGGVGLMTVVSLLQNTLLAAKKIFYA
ncbi:bifunctional methylenetetrahydrofolate dehydrogenase/methenyltetrahydrofolate cyclohydrolase FolD [Raineya orbicola]|jgi:methylenetetrahydrofolate dehydrogenase (NADP+)/methenyltetrahydrofolate cyclohydrolase|uniref:Bifunctional protein FolD n=1 Tax=Raineya orbicola TaxID=2016530 RepID=A0A2N3II25_9BACT|nr:bifunctional methylenetetrahydrofolate dehydrogenase/methenyltetrahydrofolate cyclohydrolase FolD [Raineya orbicola]PKQ69946.1 510-methylene-tetrahydrofolate-dehydrogenase/Methenyl tetrahydrofolate cyclohydrolase [Raineya orbicola]